MNLMQVMLTQETDFKYNPICFFQTRSEESFRKCTRVYKVGVYKCKYRKIMKVMINNKETETQAKTVKELAQELDLPATGCAVAISNEMVPRDEWENRLIQEGADIVIVKAFCGG